jgi:hypothetical protein
VEAALDEQARDGVTEGREDDSQRAEDGPRSAVRMQADDERDSREPGRGPDDANPARPLARREPER